MCKAQYCSKMPKYRMQGYCNACYRYFVVNKNEQYTPSEYGKLAYTPGGLPICHICGQAHTKLGQHVLNAHGISVQMYKKHYGLNNNTKLTGLTYQQMMKGYTDKYYDKVVADNLLNKGVATRIQEGNKLAKGCKKRKVRTYTGY